MKQSTQRERIGYALAGIKFGWRHERAFRGHVFAIIPTLIILFATRPSAVWWAVVLLGLGMALALELVNGALEQLADYVQPDQDPKIGAAKDMAAAGVLLVDIALVVVVVIGTTSQL